MVRSPAFSVAVSDGFAYVACNATPPQAGSHLLVVNVRNPLWPVLVGRYDTSAQWFGDIIISDRLLYVADSRNCLQVLDISDRAYPRLAGSGQSLGGPMSGGLHVFDGLVYLAGFESGLWILQYVGPQPTRAGRWTLYK